MPLSLSERDNLTLWRPSKRPFFEIYYLKFNDLTQGIAGWIRYTILAPDSGEGRRDPEASVWVYFFDTKNPQNNRALKKTFPIREARIDRDIFYFGVGPSAIFQSGARGDIGEGDHHFHWELKFSQDPSVNLSARQYPPLFYRIGFPKTKFLTPHLTTRISGDFKVGSRRFTLDNVPAHEAHLWGKDRAHSWVWADANIFKEDTHFCFDGLSARVKIGDRLTPPLTLLLFYWEGKLYSFNSPLRWFLNKSRYSLDRWRFEAGNRELRFVGQLSARVEEMVGTRHENPSGSELFGHNTYTADLMIDILRNEKSGWKSVKRLHAENSVAYEVVQPNYESQVPLLVP